MVSTGWAFSLIRFCWTADVRTPEELLKLMKVKRERHSFRDFTATYSVPVVAFYAQKKNTRTRHWSEILRNVRKTSTDRHIQTSFCALDMATLYTQWNTIDWRRHSRVETCGRSLPLKRITQYESYLGAFFHQCIVVSFFTMLSYRMEVSKNLMFWFRLPQNSQSLCSLWASGTSPKFQRVCLMRVSQAC